MAIEPLTTVLNRISDGQRPGKRWMTDPDDREWYQFVLDHKDEIKSRAEAVTISAEVSVMIRYDLARLYRRRRLSPQYIWVARLINPMGNDIDFSEIPVVYIPDGNYLKELYAQYKAGQKADER